MKTTITLFLICLFNISVNAMEDNTSIINSKDTIIEQKSTIELISETNNSETDIFQESSQSSIIYDGASYDFIFSWKKRKKKHLSSHWTGFGMGFMNYDADKVPYGKLKMSKSHNFSLNLFNYSVNIKNSNWLFVTGVGFDWFRYHFDSNAGLTKENGITFFKPAPDGINYKSNMLLAYYVTIPLLLEYQTPVGASNFHISGGVVGFIKYYSKSQIEYNIDGNNSKTVLGRDLNIRPYDLKLRLQVGIGDISVFGYYSPFSMFNKGDGPDLKTYSIGLMIGL